MSDLGKYELEGIVWESSDNDDHIVPYKKIGYANEENSLNRQGNELKCAERKGEASFNTVKEDQKTMLKKSAQMHTCNEGFTSSLDGDTKWTNLCSISDEEKTSTSTPGLGSSNVNSGDTESSAADPDLSNQAFAAENNLEQYQLNDTSCIENYLAFLENGPEDKSSNDLSFYGWPELENFEDLDDMFRDCDASLSIDIDNSDDMSWFSSSHALEGASDVLKATEQQEVFGQSNMDMRKLCPDICSSSMESCADGSGSIHQVDSQSQVHSHVSPPRHQKSSSGKRKDRTSESGVSSIQFDKLSEVGEENHLLSSRYNFSPENHQQRGINHPCPQTPKTMVEPYKHPSDHVLPSSMPSIIKSEVGPLPIISPTESLHDSNQMKSTESSNEDSFKNPACSENNKKGKLNHRRLSKPAINSNSRVHRIGSDPFCAKKTIPCGENESEGQSVIDDGEIGFPRNTIQEGSCTSPGRLNDVAIDASSLKQLQHVMEKLDIRTKLCIRDSLYRLARSAAQRHKCDSPDSGGDDKDANGALLTGTNKCTGFIDMETDTNPIDRSIAHLLFHRPSDPSASAAPVTSVAVKSHMVKAHKTATIDKPAGGQEITLLNEDTTNQRN